MSETHELYARLGVRPFVNAAGHETAFGGSLMPPEVLAAMAAAGRHYVSLRELQQATGRRVAEVVGAPAALITSGAAGAILLATAACLSQGDAARALALPRTPPGGRNEVVVWRMTRPNYLYPPCEAAGGVLVEVGQPEAAPAAGALLAAIGPRTAAVLLMIHALDEAPGNHGQSWEALAGEVARGAAARGVPVLIDAAAELPPRDLIRRLFALGVSGVMVSGGKAIRGPQSSGFLAASAELIDGALLVNVPDRLIGRPLKVGKEELCALTVAVERFFAADESAQLAQWRTWMSEVAAAARGVPGARGEVVEGVPGYGRPPLVPKAVIRLAGGEAGAQEVVTRLGTGDPPVQVMRRGDAVLVNPMALEPGQAGLVASRLRQALQARRDVQGSAA